MNPSLRYLYQRCRELFPKGTTYFFDFQSWPHAAEVNCLLIGLAPLTVQLKWLWPSRKRFRLWVLCRAHHRLLTEVMGFPAHLVGVVPRYQITRKNPKARARTLRLDQDFDLIYSGRILGHKNFALACAVVSEIQKRTSFQVTFHICGARLENQRPTIQREIRKHTWKVPPVFHGDLGINWQKKKWKNPALINLSTFCYEDFGVSVAQADALGWPLILSQWGAHLDIDSIGLHSVPAHQILKAQSPKQIQATAQKIVRDMIRISPTKSNTGKKPFPGAPRPLDHLEMEKIMSRMDPKMKKEIFDYFDLSREKAAKRRNKRVRLIEQALSSPFK